jgi:hypothetical protein
MDPHSECRSEIQKESQQDRDKNLRGSAKLVVDFLFLYRISVAALKLKEYGTRKKNFARSDYESK